MKQKVVIIGHGFTSRLAVTRSVAQIGCEVTLIVMTGYRRFTRKLNTTKPIDGYSKYVGRILYCYAKDDEGLIQLLLDKCADQSQRVIIIPDSDFSAAAIDKNQERLRDYFLFPHIHHTSGAIVEWMDKLRQKELARQVGMNVAGASIISIENHQYAIPQSVIFPCFTKPLATIAGGKRFLRRCDNEAELRTVLDMAGSTGDLQVLVEDFKTIDTEYAVLGFSDGRNVIIPSVIQILQMAHGGHYGVACQGKIMPVDGYEPIVERFKEFVQQIGYVGLFDIDFYMSDGILYFGELNLRFGGSGYAVTKMGVNLPAMLVKVLCGESIDEMQSDVTGEAIYVNERMCLDDWYGGFITSKNYQQIIQESDIHFVINEKDPVPGKKLKDERRCLSLKRWLRIQYKKLKGVKK